MVQPTDTTQPVDEQQAESPIDDYQSSDQDINSLITKFLRPIDRFRSHNVPNPCGELDQPGLSSSQDVQESRTHAFYRMLGLPAIAPSGKFFNPGYDPAITAEDEKKNADILAAIPMSVRVFSQQREFQSRFNFNLFSNPCLESTIFSVSMALLQGQRSLSVADIQSIKSLTDIPSQSQEIPARRSIIQERYKKPNASDPEITWFNSYVPHRLAPFMTDPVITANLDPRDGDRSVIVGAPFLEQKDLEYQSGKYAKRPGIEFILRLRLRQQNLAAQGGMAIANLDPSGVFNNPVLRSEAQSGGISIDSQREIAAALSDVGVSKADVDQVLNTAGEIELYTLNGLVKSFKCLIHLWVKSVEDIERKYQQIVWVPVSNPGGPENGTKVNTTYVIPKTPLDTWEIEQRITRLEIKQALAKMQQDIGETADGTSLAFSDFAISEFQNLNELFTKELKEQKAQRDKLEAEASNALRTLEFISGEVSGLGLIDVIAIYMALWSVDVNVLLNLIDDRAAQRLNQIDELRTGGTASRANTPGNAKIAYGELAGQIQTILSYGDRLYQCELGSPDTQEGGDIPRPNQSPAAQSFA